MNHLLNSTGVSVHENRMLKYNEALFMKETNQLCVGNIYPFMFLGCGKFYTIDQCVDFSIKYALDFINRQIDTKYNSN